MRRSLAALTLVLAGCAQHGAGLPSATQGFAFPNTAPPDCKRQVSKSDYASATDELRPVGGRFCVPAFGGFGGFIESPNILGSRRVALTLTSNTKNVDKEPSLGSGTPMFYLEFKIGAVTFGTTLKGANGLTGSKITAGQSYTAYGLAEVGTEKISLGPCYSVARKGPYGGVIGGIGALVKGRQVPSSATGVIEIYSGAETTTECGKAVI